TCALPLSLVFKLRVLVTDPTDPLRRPCPVEETQTCVELHSRSFPGPTAIALLAIRMPHRIVIKINMLEHDSRDRMTSSGSDRRETTASRQGLRGCLFCRRPAHATG